MSLLIKKKFERKIVDYIKNIMMNRDIDSDNDWWESKKAQQEITALANTDKFYICNSEKMEIYSDVALLFMRYITHKDDSALVTELSAELDLLMDAILEREKDGDTTLINEIGLVIFIGNYKSKIRLKKLLDKEFEVKLRKIMAVRGTRKVRVELLFVFDSIGDSEEIKICNVNRYESIQMPPINNNINWESYSEKSADICGYVFNVELYQLVDLYNKIGDQLFKKNVRYGISEQFGVDSAIKETLENSPSMFWYRNNGVTILVENDKFKLDRVGEIVLSYDLMDELNFSVVNGAQTITAAADFYFTKEYEYELETEKSKKDKLREMINKAKDVRVMLRIINIRIPEEGIASESSQISVALNRQKPIKAEDIAFATPYIEKLVSYVEANEARINVFKLVKRGEKLQDETSISLPEFVRARKACIGKPGEARTKGINHLLEYESNGSGYSFKDKDIFIRDWEESEGAELDELFSQNYGAVLFAVKVAEIYEKNRKTISSTIVNNGKWYFVSLMLAVLTEDSPNDYSDFNHRYSLVKSCITDLIACFVNDVEEVIKRNRNKFPAIDSNIFKKDILFKDVKKDILSDENLQLKSKVLSCFSPKEPDSSKKRSGKVKVDTVLLKKLGKKISVKDQAEALIVTFKEYLNLHELKLDELVERISILSFDKVDSSTFRDENIIDINGRTVYIGTSLNFEAKVKYTNELAKNLSLTNGEIEWEYEGDLRYSNSVE